MSLDQDFYKPEVVSDLLVRAIDSFPESLLDEDPEQLKHKAIFYRVRDDWYSQLRYSMKEWKERTEQILDNIDWAEQFNPGSSYWLTRKPNHNYGIGSSQVFAGQSPKLPTTKLSYWELYGYLCVEAAESRDKHFQISRRKYRRLDLFSSSRVIPGPNITV